jgi:rod shape-determining protein MreC
VGCLVLASLVLITLTFRSGDDGPLAGVHSAATSALRPFAVGAERIAQPFRDAYSWADSLLDARSEAERLREENRRLEQEAIRNAFAVRQNSDLRRLLDFVDGPRFPEDYGYVAAEVIGRPSPAFQQAVVIAAGEDQGVRVDDPVINADGLVGVVTRVFPSEARVRLLSDPEAAASAEDVRTGAQGIVLHAAGTRETLVFDRVRKRDVVRRGDRIVTAGWRSGDLTSLFPQGIPIGIVTSASSSDTNLFQDVQIDPFVDFGELDAVLVLVPQEPRE